MSGAYWTKIDIKEVIEIGRTMLAATQEHHPESTLNNAAVACALMLYMTLHGKEPEDIQSWLSHNLQLIINAGQANIPSKTN